MARKKKRFQAPDTPGRREYQIKQKSWKKYTESLKKLSDKASDELKKYLLEGHTEEETIDVAYALVTKYGEASSELACQMYEALAEYSGARVAAAEPAETATYGETARSIRGAMMRTRDAAAISSSAGRLVKLASVDTMMKNALRDGAEWAWIPQGDTCAFCIMLASRGWVKASEDALKNGHAEHIHNNCDCTYCVRFDHETTVEGYDPDALYDQYRNAGDTPRERLNALRRQNYAANRDKINAQKRVAYARRKNNDIDAAASILPKRFKAYLPSEERRTEIIKQGISEKKPVFANDLLGVLGRQLPSDGKLYDVVLHGHEYGLEFFGERIDVETLCAIIAQRSDYSKGSDIRLISCYTGAKDDGVAQYIANKLGVTVWAPDKQGIILKNVHGELSVYSGSRKGVHDGKFVPFYPHPREGNNYG